MASCCDATLLFLHQAFVAFSDVLTAEANSWDACKAKLQDLQEQWQKGGLFGANAFHAITQHRGQINWQDMAPDQFARFYRFVHYVCRDAGKRNISMDLAVAAWRLLLPGRFRLLDRWCAFAASSRARVVTEDTWRQVLDFSRTIHEDLSNYDAAGAWAVLLDEFVEDMRTSRRRNSVAAPCDGGRLLYGGGGSGGVSDLLSRRVSSGAELSAALYTAATAGGAAGGGGHGDADDGAGGMMSFMASLSPRCGSKRREPDVDVVAEQLSAMPLGHGSQPLSQGPASAHGLPPAPPPHGYTHANGHGYGPGTDMPYSQGYGAPYGHRSGGGAGGGCGGAEAACKRMCLGHPQAEAQQLQQQQPTLPAQQLQPFLLGGMGCGGGVGGGEGGAACGGGEGHNAPSMGGGLGTGLCGRTGSSGHPMSCSTGSMDSDARHGPVGAAAMAEGGQDNGAANMHEQQSQQHGGGQQRRAIKARRSGVSDIVKTAVADALGF